MILPPNGQMMEASDGGYGSAKLFIGGLSYDTTDDSLANYFRRYGEVASAIVLRDPVTSHSRGFGFVTFVDEQSAQQVLIHSRNHIIDGRKVEAKIAVPKNQTLQRKPNFSQNNMMNGYPAGYLQPMGMNMGLGVGGDPYAVNLPIGMGYDVNLGGMGAQMPPQQMYGQHMGLGDDMYRQVPTYNKSINAEPFGYGFDLSQDYRNQAQIPQMRAPGRKVSIAEPDSQLNERGSSYHTHSSSNRSNFEEEEHDTDTFLRRPTFPQTAPVSPANMRKMSMPPSRLAVLGELDGLNDQLGGMSLKVNAGQEERKVLVTNISLETSEETLKNVFGAFGTLEVAEPVIDSSNNQRKAYALLTFKDASSVENLFNFQAHSGAITVNGQKVQLRRFDGQPEEFMRKPFKRSNTLPLESESFLEEEIEPRAFSGQVPMMRAHSVSQSMFGHSGFNDNDFGGRIPAMDLARDDKMRSLSFSNIALPLHVQRMRTANGRRTSSFATAGDRSNLQRASLASNLDGIN